MKPTACKKVAVLFGAVLLLFSCRANMDEPPPASVADDEGCWMDFFDFCRESKPNKAEEAKMGLQRTVKVFMDALVANDVETAGEHATYYGLGTLLYLDLAQVDSYSVERTKYVLPQAFVHMKINGSEETVPFFFGKKRGKWQFEGIDMYDLLDGNHVALHYRRKVPDKRPQKAADTTSTNTN